MHFSEEWLKKRLAETASEDEKVIVKMGFINSSSDFLNEFCEEICEELVKSAEERNDHGLRAFVKVHQSYRKLAQGNVREFSEGMKGAEQLAMEYPHSGPSSIALQMCAFMYWNSGERERAFELAYFARKFWDGTTSHGMGWSDFQLAVFHSDLKDYATAKRYFKTAEKIALENSDFNYQLARIRSGLGAIAIAENNMQEAMQYNTLALEGYRECGHRTALSRALNDLGTIYYRNGDTTRAKAHLNEAMVIRKELKYVPGLITTEIELAKIYLNENDYINAESLLREALELSTLSVARQKAVTCHLLLAEMHKARSEFQLAFNHLEEGYRLRAELDGEEATNKVKHLQQKHATESAEHEAEIHRLKNVELKLAYDAIEDQNKSILDSINYARRIQTALLGSRTMLTKHIPENFVLYKPKDIVSGDFWWCAEEKDEFYFAVADCTGHGVPGAFMSLLNINMLDRALTENENASPATLLNEVRKRVISSLNREGQEEARDGMDVVLCALNKTGRLRFACANNTLIHIRNGVLNVHGPDKFPVGLCHTSDPEPFTEFEIQLQQGDSVYLSTDGFADQFGGQKGKKYKQKRLREFFQQHAHLSLSDQESKLEKEFESWRGNLEQVDDVLIVGFKSS